MTASDEKEEGRLEDLEIGPPTPVEVKDAIRVLARGMRDNPIHVAAFGDEPSLRLTRLGSLLENFNSILQWEALVARDGQGTIVGVMVMRRPGRCRLSSGYEDRTLWRDGRNNPDVAHRIAWWLEAWRERDPRERHWHFGPFAVEAHLQGRGIGSALLRVFCAQMDAGKENAHLETDKAENISLYERFGFEVVDESTVLGASNWFMNRRPQGSVGDNEGGISS